MGFEREGPVLRVSFSVTVTLALLGMLLCSSAVVGPGLASGSPAEPIRPTWHVEPSYWAASSVGPGERSLELEYSMGGCGLRNNHTSVRETARSVLIEMHAEVPEYPPGTIVSCPASRSGFLTITLVRALAGRRIRGHQTAFGGEGGESDQPVPRLVGFAPQDAYRALALKYLRGAVLLVPPSRGLRRVVAQYPTPGAVVRRNTVVHLRVAEG
jgi:hypothetical protein